MPGAALDLRRRAQCGDVCWDTCGLAAFGLWTTGKRKEPRCCKAYRAFRLSTLHVLYGFVVSSNEIASKTIIAEKHFLYQCCVTFSLYVWNGLVFVAFLFCVDARSKRVLCRKQKDADASDV